MRAALIMLLCSPAFAGSLAELIGIAGAPEPAPIARPRVNQRVCPPDFAAKHAGDCWTETSFFDGTDSSRAYVHPAGWIVDARCFKDTRFTARELIAALDLAAKKIDPVVLAEKGGCFGTLNQPWGREMKEQVWSNRMLIQCPPNFDPQSRTCAEESARAASITEGDRTRSVENYYRMITIRNVKGCMGADTSGLAGVLFHESLHAVEADSEPVEVHNKSWERPQYEFIYDRVYGTEAVCFEGRKANIVQCHRAIAYHNDHPDREQCRGFSAYFTDSVPQTVK